jgi:predicted nucleic acid-binding protein
LASSGRVVLDASAVLRLLQRGVTRVAELIETQPCAAPDLIRLEVANGLATATRSRRIDAGRAHRLFGLFRLLPIEIADSAGFVPAALSLSIELGISAYEATYLVLAGREDALLLTADRRLAALATRSELLA